MKLTIQENDTLQPDQLVLTCHDQNAKIKKIAQYIQNMDSNISATLDDKQYFLTPEQIYYFESVEKQTYAYLKNKVMKCDLRLYEIESQLAGNSFVRISKTTIVNLMKVQSIRPLFNRNLCIELNNDETIICSRRYVEQMVYYAKRKARHYLYCACFSFLFNLLSLNIFYFFLFKQLLSVLFPVFFDFLLYV